MATPAKNPHGKRSQRTSENFDPNHLAPATPKKPIKSPSINSTKSKKPAMPKSSNKEEKDEKMIEVGELEGSSKVRKMKTIMLEEAMISVPQPGAGRVMHMVKAFERLLSFTKEGKSAEEEEKKGRVVNWALPGLLPKDFSSSNFERDSCEHSSMDSNGDRFSWGSSSSDGDPRSQSKSIGSSVRSWKKKLRATNQQPFKLRTEQRGKVKEDHFLKKVKEMLLEEEKQRVRIAQGLPWTTDNPECLLKPSVKESTEPIDLVLHSDVRAVERAEFDCHIAERLSLIEQINLERERRRKLEEDEEIQRLRKELVPKAQPMPYFDRPFVPKRSPKPQTVPKEPSVVTRTKKTCVRKLLKKQGHG